MLRIRSIHYNAFRSQKLARLSAEGERCWWRLQCLCDDDGRAEDDPDVICGFVFPKRRDFTPEMVDGWLQELHDLGLIVRYEVAGQRYLSVHQWHDYQHPRRPQSSKIPPCPEPSVAVATGPDVSRHVTQERSGEERIRGEEGESEGEAEPRSAYLRPVDNPNPVTLGLVAQLDAIAQTAALKSQPATGTEPLTSSSALTNGVGK